MLFDRFTSLHFPKYTECNQSWYIQNVQTQNKKYKVSCVFEREEKIMDIKWNKVYIVQWARK